MGWGERTPDTGDTTVCCRAEPGDVCGHGTGRALVLAEVGELGELGDPLPTSAPGRLLAWIPAGPAVRRLVAADVDEVAEGEIDFLGAVIHEQCRLYDLDLFDGRCGAAALAALLAVSDHTSMLATHDRLDPAVHAAAAAVLARAAVAVARFAPTEVRNP